MRRSVVALGALVLALSTLVGTNGSAATGTTITRLNTGGPAYTAADGRAFGADGSFSGGGTYSTAAAIAGTSDPALYTNERWGQFSYALPVANGTYDVTFHFVEIYYTTGSCVGKRIFSMDVVDTPTNPDLVNIDVCAGAGGANRALVQTVSGVSVTDGVLDIRSVYGAADDPEVAAIEIVPSGVAPPTVTARTPAGGGTGVSTGATVTATFSRAMDASTITNSSVTLSSSAGAVPASVSYNAMTAIATLSPAAPLANSTTYTAQLDGTIKAADGTSLAGPVSWSFTTAAASTATTVRINSGGGGATTGDGRAFGADRYFTGGTVSAPGGIITGTTDPTLYGNERWGQFSYAVPVANGTYDVKLHFVELYYTPPCVGKRVFGIDIRDTPGVDVPSLDICAAVGARAALVKTLRSVTVSDGVLDLTSIYGTADDPEIAAIEIVPAGPPPSVSGEWSIPIAWPLVAVHATLAPTGNVLVWEDWSQEPGSERIWNPTTGAFVPVPLVTDNRFCAGHVNLADGRTLTVGGYDGKTAGVGTNKAVIFDSMTRTWTPAASMAEVRWYPTATTLSDGRVLVTSGDNLVWDTTKPTAMIQGWDSLPEVYDPSRNTWTQLPSARLLMPYYPFMFVLPDGRVLDAGADTVTRVLDPFSWTWQTIGTSPFDGMTAVMYRPGKVMKAGTWSDPSFKGLPVQARTAVLDMTQTAPAWRETAPMANPRSYQNMTILADGTVLATGGGASSDGESPATAVYPAELWNPSTEKWTTLSSMLIERLYHSVALLLPDGRVLVAGSGGSGNLPDENNAEIFSPPYLFKGARPTITNAPAVAQYGQGFTVQTPDAASIAKVSLVRLGSVTHAFNQDQRFDFLDFTAGAGSLTVQAPANANLAPPGYYMLFLVNGDGVPSISSMVRLPAAWEDSQPPTAPSGLAANGATGKATLSWSAATDNVGIARYDVYRSTTSGFPPSLANRIGQTAGTSYVDNVAAGTYYYVVRAEDAAGNVGPASNEVGVTVSNTTPPPPTGLVAAYNFDAGAGTALSDVSGNGNNGTIANGTWSTAGHSGGALSFNGTSTSATVADSASLDLTSGMTLEAWVSPSALGTAWRTAVLKEQPPSNLTYALYANTDTTRPSAHVFTSSGESILKGTSVLTLNAWNHVAATYDGTTLRVYLNGVQTGSSTNGKAISVTTGKLKIGGNAIWGEWFKGLIDDVRIYDRALGASEIQTDMNRPVTGP